MSSEVMDVRETSPESGRAMGPLKQSARKAALSPTLLLMTLRGKHTSSVEGQAPVASQMCNPGARAVWAPRSLKRHLAASCVWCRGSFGCQEVGASGLFSR